MVNLDSMFVDWGTKLKSGDNEFAMVVRTEDDWCLVCGGGIDLIMSLKIFVDKGDGLFPEYEYDYETGDIGDFGCALLFKGTSEMLYKDCNSIEGFGIKGVQPPAKEFCVYMRTEMKEFMFKCNNSGVDSLLRYLYSEEECDEYLEDQGDEYDGET